MSIVVDESGMRFGPFAENDLFPVEKVLDEHPLGDGICKVEFLVRGDGEGTGSSVMLVEARSSIPRHSDAFFHDIHAKMLHSLTVWVATVCGRHPHLRAHVPERLCNVRHLALPVRLVLVIPSAPTDALSPLTDKFRRYFRIDRKLWGIRDQDIRVVNRSRAVRLGLAANA
jgi:hypothetical protein